MGIRMAARPASAGAFANNLREFESLRDFFTSATVVTLVDLPFVLLFIAIVWWIGGPVALVPAIAVPLVIGFGLLLQVPLNRIVRRTFQEAAQKHGVLVESINGLETIKSIGAEGRMQRNWEQFVSATAALRHARAPARRPRRQLRAAGAEPGHVGVVIFGVYRIARRADDGRRAGRLHHHHRPRHGAARPGRRHPHPLSSGARRLRCPRPDRWRCRSSGRREARFLHRPQLQGELEFKDVTFSLSRAEAAGARAGLVRDQAGRAGRPGRPHRLRQDHDREAGARACTSPIRARC